MLLTTSLIFAFLPSILAAEPSKSPIKHCKLQSPITGLNFDLTTIQLHPPSSKSSNKDARTESWHSRGYDYNANFTLNFCGPVIEDLGDVEGIPDSRVANISAFYTKDGNTYSIGQANAEPIFRGRKLVMNYTDGSPCPNSPSSDLKPREIIDDDDDDDRDSKNPPSKDTTHRYKSTLLSFLCDRDPQYTTHPSISFIGTPDSCTYLFEVRSRAACGGAASSSPSSLGPGGVFGVILGIAVCVYLIGGCMYNRTVMHQRGWRQCPNYGVWMGIGDFFGDFFQIFASSISRNLNISIPSFNRAFNTGGYHRVGTDSSPSIGGVNGRGGGRGGVGRPEDENRLIDQLDEEWDD